jgi:ankyrin repeat protein
VKKIFLSFAISAIIACLAGEAFAENAATRELMQMLNEEESLSPEKVLRLISAGADVNARDDEGVPLLLLALRGNAASDVVYLLVAAGADVRARAPDNGEWQRESSIMCARGVDREPDETKDVLENLYILIEAGADVNAKDFHGRTAFWYFGDVEILRFLIIAGADVNARDNGGEPALCSQYENYDAMSLMIENGADSYSKNYTVWEIFGSIGLMSYLLENGADVNSRNEDGDTLLIHAARGHNNDYFIIKLLLEKGADIRLKNNGMTAPDIFKENNPREEKADYDIIVKLLSGAAKAPARGGRTGEMPLVPGVYTLDEANVSYSYHDRGEMVIKDREDGYEISLELVTGQEGVSFEGAASFHGNEITAEGDAENWPRKLTITVRGKDMLDIDDEDGSFSGTYRYSLIVSQY